MVSLLRFQQLLAVRTRVPQNRFVPDRFAVSFANLSQSGRDGALRLHLPLRTVRESFPSYGSSNSKVIEGDDPAGGFLNGPL